MDGALGIVGLELRFLAFKVFHHKKDGDLLGMDAVVFAQEFIDVSLLSPLQPIITHGLVDATNLVVPQGFGLSVK